MRGLPTLRRARRLAVGCGGGVAGLLLTACTQAERRNLATALFELFILAVLILIGLTVLLILYLTFLVLGLAMAISGWSNPSATTRKWGFIAAGANVATALLVGTLDAVIAYAMMDDIEHDPVVLALVGLAALPPLMMSCVNIVVSRRRPLQGE